MEKVYESIACAKVSRNKLHQLFDLLKFYSAPHLHISTYLKYETEFTNIKNRTSIFVKELHSCELAALDVDLLLDTDRVHFNTLKHNTPSVKSIINGTKFQSGGLLVRVLNSSDVSGDIHSLLLKLGCR